jgi:hypothetical protein
MAEILKFQFMTVGSIVSKKNTKGFNEVFVFGKQFKHFPVPIFAFLVFRLAL